MRDILKEYFEENEDFLKFFYWFGNLSHPFFCFEDVLVCIAEFWNQIFILINQKDIFEKNNRQNTLSCTTEPVFVE